MLPEGWKKTKIGKEYSIQLGKMLNKSAKENYPQFRYLTNINVRWGEIVVNELNMMYFSENERKKFSLLFGDLLVCEGGDVGRCAIWENNLENCFYQKAIHRVRSLHGNLTRYLKYVLEYFSKTGKFKDIATKTSIAHLTKEQLENTSIDLPPLPEQEKIAAILSTWDKAISTADAMLENSRQQKKALMQQLLTGKRRLSGFKGEWCFLQAKKLFNSISIKHRPEEQLLAVTQEDGVVPRALLDRRVVMPEGDVDNYKFVKKGDFIISLRSFQGGIEYSNYNGLVSPAYTIIEKRCDIDDAFYRHYFKSSLFIGKLAIAVIGIRDGKQISYDDFAGIPLPVPPLDEQRAIAAVLDAADREIALLEQKAARLREEKKALMQQMLTGKRRVRV